MVLIICAVALQQPPPAAVHRVWQRPPSADLPECRPNVASRLGQRRRRWPSHDATLGNAAFFLLGCEKVLGDQCI